MKRWRPREVKYIAQCRADDRCQMWHSNSGNLAPGAGLFVPTLYVFSSVLEKMLLSKVSQNDCEKVSHYYMTSLSFRWSTTHLSKRGVLMWARSCPGWVPFAHLIGHLWLLIRITLEWNLENSSDCLIDQLETLKNKEWCANNRMFTYFPHSS